MTLRHERAERHTIQIRKGDNVKVLAGKDAGKATKPGKGRPPTDIGGACESGASCAAGVCVSAHGKQYCSRSCGPWMP